MSKNTTSPKLRFLLICLCLTYSLAFAFICLGSHFISKQVFSSTIDLIEMDAINRGTFFNSTLSNIKNTFHLIASRTRLRELLDEKENGIIEGQWFKHRALNILRDAEIAISTNKNNSEVGSFFIAEIAILNALGELLLSTSEDSDRNVSSSKYDIEHSLLLNESGKYFMSYRGEFFTEQGRKYFLFLRLDISSVADKVLIEKSAQKGDDFFALAFMNNKSNLLTTLVPRKLDISLFQKKIKHQQHPEVMNPISFVDREGNGQHLNTFLRLNEQNWFVLGQKPLRQINYVIYKIQSKFLLLSMLIILGSLIPFGVFAFQLSKELRSI